MLGQTEGSIKYTQRDAWTNGRQINEHKNRQTHKISEQLSVYGDRWVQGRTDRQTDGRMDGWPVSQIDEERE